MWGLIVSVKVTLGKIVPLCGFVIFLSDFEWHIPVLNHVFKFDSTQEESHKNEVEEKQWPENFYIRALKQTGEICHQRCLHQGLP